jgi:hypothetical protein
VILFCLHKNGFLRTCEMKLNNSATHHNLLRVISCLHQLWFIDELARWNYVLLINRFTPATLSSFHSCLIVRNNALQWIGWE